MHADPRQWTTDELLSQAEWLGALARRLVADPSEADDVLQETWAAALSRPPERERALRPWLARVARNFARMRRRSERARSEREASSARRAAAERDELAPDELSARLEAQRLVMDALSTLREPQRSTVLLAYFEHHSSEQIAARQGVSAGTVRWRLKCAIDELRARLDERRGARSSWVLALGPLTRSKPYSTAAAPALAWQGAWWMGNLIKLVVGAAAVVGVVTWATFSAAPERERAATLSNEPVAVEFTPLEPRPGGERREVSAPPATASASGAAASLPGPAPTSVEARVVDESHAPLRDVEVELDSYAGGPALRSLSAADGGVRFEFAAAPTQRSLQLSASGVGRVPARASVLVEPGQHVHAGTLVLERGGDIAGRVTDERGAPLAGVVIALDELDLPHSEVPLRRRREPRTDDRPHVLSGADGSFAYRGAPVGMTRIAAGCEGFYTSFSAPIEVRAGWCSRGVELVLERQPEDALITGVVLDPAGAPLPFASLRYRYERFGGSGGGTTNTDERGRFRLVAEPGSTYQLTASDPRGRFGVAQRRDVTPGTLYLELRLAERIELEVVARTRSGSPIERFTVSAKDPEQHSFGGASDAGPHAGGRARFAPSLSAFVLELRAPGFDLARVGPFSAAPATPVEVVLDPLPGLRGRVAHRATPAGGARVEVYRRGAGRHEKNGFAMRFDPSVVDAVTTDPSGAFELTLRESGDFTVLVNAEGFALAELEVDGFDKARGRDSLELELVRGGAIEGSLRPEHAADAAGAVVAFSRGDGRAFTQRVGADGRYRAERLTPGRWEVRQVAEELSPQRNSTRSWPRGSVVPPWNCEVVDGATTRFDLGPQRDEPNALLNVRVLVDGAPAAGWRLRLQAGALGQARGDAADASLDAHGAAKLAANDTGSAFLVATAIGGRLDGMRYVRALELTLGVAEVLLDLRTATVSVDRAALQPPLGVLWLGRAGEFALRALPDTGGEALTVLAGELALCRIDPRATDSDPRRWPALGTVRVDAGGHAQLRAD